MNKFVVTLLFSLCIHFSLQAQIALQYNDTTICPGNTIDMCAAFTGEADPLNTDDDFTSELNIGFDFVFFGNTYSQCLISDNGFVSFDLQFAGDYSSFTWGASTASGEANNAIHALFQDGFLPSNGVLRYQSFGSPGSRRFVAEWCQVAKYGGTTCNQHHFTSQVILYEGSNIIEIHTTDLPGTPGCPSTNGGANGIQGVRNIGGTTAVYPPGRGPTDNWGTIGATNDARRFTPNGTTYDVDTIAFNPWVIIDEASSEDLAWYTQDDPTTPFTIGACATVTPTGEETYYTVRYDGIAGCMNDTVSFIDTVFIHYGTTYDTTFVEVCAGYTYSFYGQEIGTTGIYDTLFSSALACDSFVTLNLTVVDPGDPGSDSTARLCLNEGTVNAFDYLSGDPDIGGSWAGIGVSPDGSFDPAQVGVGTYLLTYTLSAPFELSPGQCDTTAVVTFNVVNDIIIDFDFTYGLGCTSDTVHFNNLSEPGQYWWSFGDDTYPDDTTKNPSHIYENQAQYPVRLTVQNLEGCIDSVTKMVDVAHPFAASFTQSVDSVCQSALTLIQFTDSSTGNIAGWQWDFGDGDTSTMQNPAHTYTTAGVHRVRLVVNEPIPCYDTFYREVYVDSTPFIKLTQDKHAICVGDAVNYSLDYLQPSVSVAWEFSDGIHWEDDGTTSHSYSNAGLYWTTVTSNYLVCDAVTTKDSVIVHSLPYVDLGPDTSLCLDGHVVVLTDDFNSSIADTRWEWNTGDTTNSLRVTSPGTYTVNVTRNDCSTVDHVIVAKDCYTDIPNAFTPNGDGENDYFYPRQLLSQGVKTFSMKVFNRWGQQVFMTENTSGRGWDGNFNDVEQAMGVYIYQIDVVYDNDRSEQYTGNITLVR